MAAILAQESRYQTAAINHQTKDYSIAQINEKTIKAYGFDKHRLMVDNKYAIECMARVLVDLKTTAPRDLYWWGRYNSSKPDLKMKYVKLVNKFL